MSDKKNIRRAMTPENRELQMIALAEEEVEYQIRNHKASSQVLTHYLKLSSLKHQLELEKIKRENELLTAKTEAIHSNKRIEELYADAINALKKYGG